jgi:hypothetical protein
MLPMPRLGPIAPRRDPELCVCDRTQNLRESAAVNLNAYDANTQVTPAKELSPIAWRWVLALVGLKLLVHLITSGHYGYFRDELYYLDCARHLMWGYVDDTPGIVWVFKLALVLGGSLPVVRLLAALGGAGTVLLGSLLARELGGGRFAQVFAGLCVLAAPAFLALTSVLCVGSFEPLFWIGCVLLVVRIARTGKSRLWWWFGMVAGLGLEMKYTMGLVLACFYSALLLTPLRRELRRPAFWGGVAVMALLFAPTLLWQVRHHFPLLTSMETIRRDGKNVVLPPLAFIVQQISILNLTLLPYWLAGLGYLLFFRGPNLRMLAWFYLFLLAAMIVLHGKDYYVAAIYPMLFAAGGTALEQAFVCWRWTASRVWPKALVSAHAFGMFAIAVPAVLPLLPPQRLLAYQAALGVRPQKTEVSHDGPLEQRLGDQFGWPEMVAEVARFYQTLPAEERARTAIITANYGEAGAIDQFGPALGLPRAVCAHQATSFWGLPEVEPQNAICIGWNRRSMERHFDSVTLVIEHRHPWGMAEENRPIYFGRNLHPTLKEMWPRLTYWN